VQDQPNPLVQQGFATEALPPPVQKTIQAQGIGDAIGLIIGNLLFDAPLQTWQVQPPALLCNIKGLQPLSSSGKLLITKSYDEVMQQYSTPETKPQTQPAATTVAGTSGATDEANETVQQLSTTENQPPPKSWWQRYKYWIIGALTLGGLWLYQVWQQRKGKRKAKPKAAALRPMRPAQRKAAA
jgi:hypothetical protein